MSERGTRKNKTGYVVSDKMDKTRIVEVVSLSRHYFYKKTVKRTKKFMAEDSANESRTGDLVKITETRPLSKNKRWRILKILERAK